MARLAAFHSATENARRKATTATQQQSQPQPQQQKEKCACGRVADELVEARLIVRLGTRATLVDWLAGWLAGWMAGWQAAWLIARWPGPKPFSTNSALRTTRQHTTTTPTTTTPTACAAKDRNYVNFPTENEEIRKRKHSC